jgi:hypothetical protein
LQRNYIGTQLLQTTAYHFPTTVPVGLVRREQVERDHS